MNIKRSLSILAALTLLAAACSGDDDAAPPETTAATPETTAAPETTEPAPETTEPAPETTEPAPEPAPEVRSVDAPVAGITVDGDIADWADVDGLSFTMEQIVGETIESKDGTFKAAHDDENLYVLFTVDDDYDLDLDDAHLSASNAVLWAVDPDAGAHMGSEEPDRETSLGMVDIWHWELECGLGEPMGGRVAGPGDGDPGNDSGCNFDDEWSTNPETREDDNGEGAENSLLGVFTHTNPVQGEDGTWYFEMSRPLQTGDAQDAQFEVGGTALLALAYWDADNSVEGWDDAEHVQTSNQGFIEVNLTDDVVSEPMAAMRSVDAPEAAITVDGDIADWADVGGLSFTMEQIVGETIESKDGTFKAAHDDENLYVLFTVDDDYDLDLDDAHLSASNAVLWAVDPDAGAHMGSEEPDRETSLGMVDIWHWELECGLGEPMGGRVAGPGDGDPGNDSGCNFDDEWSTNPETREDDNGEGAENSLLGVFTHTNPVQGEDGTWYFEMSRPLQTGDAQDAQFEVGGTALLALAYWDADNSVEGWDDAEHVQTSNQGFIEVNLVDGHVHADGMRHVDAPEAAITVDGDIADWADVEGLSFTMEQIVGETIESKDGTFKAAHDGDHLYVLFTVDDDYDFNAEDAHLTAANAVLWAVDPDAGAHMGSEEPDRETSLGMVDIWHWELECALGEPMGGSVNGPGDGDPGNDSGCNFDDEWSTNPATREDDNGVGAENSLLGVFTHTNPVAGEDGTWYFEMSRHLQTGDAQDAQFEVGGTALLALAYWDADNSVEGWDDAEHVQTSNQGFIEVNLVG